MTNYFGLAILGIVQQFHCDDPVAVIYSIKFIKMDGRPVGLLFCMLSVVHLVNVIFASEFDNNVGNLQLDVKVSLIFLQSLP